MLNVDWNSLIEQNKQVIGNSVFDTLTGAIKGKLENSGVELQSEYVPIAKSESKVEGPTALVDRPWTYFMIAGIGLVAFLIYKKKRA